MANSGSAAAKGLVLAFGAPRVGAALGRLQRMATCRAIPLVFAAPSYQRPAGCVWSANSASSNCYVAAYDLGAGDAARFGLPISRSDPGRWIRLADDAAELVCVKGPWCVVERLTPAKFANASGTEAERIRAARTAGSHGLIRLEQDRYADPDMF